MPRPSRDEWPRASLASAAVLPCTEAAVRCLYVQVWPMVGAPTCPRCSGQAPWQAVWRAEQEQARLEGAEP